MLTHVDWLLVLLKESTAVPAERRSCPGFSNPVAGRWRVASLRTTCNAQRLRDNQPTLQVLCTYYYVFLCDIPIAVSRSPDF